MNDKKKSMAATFVHTFGLGRLRQLKAVWKKVTLLYRSTKTHNRVAHNAYIKSCHVVGALAMQVPKANIKLRHVCARKHADFAILDIHNTHFT